MKPPDSEQFLIVVDRIIFQQSFATILSGQRLKECDDPVAVGGASQIVVRAKCSAYLNPPIPGETWQVAGRWTQTSKYGVQFDALRATRIKPQGRLIIPFIAARVEGIGPVRAARLWEALSSSLEEVLTNRNVDALSAVLVPEQPTVSRRLANSLMTAWIQLEHESAVLMWLQKRGIDDVRSAERLLNVLGGRAVEVLEDNPYVLVSLLPWSKLDALAQRVLVEDAPASSPRIDPRRLVGAADAVVKDLISEGHTMVGPDELRAALARKLGIATGSRIIDRAIRLAERNSAILRSDGNWRAPGCALLEDELGHRLQMLSSSSSGLTWDGNCGTIQLASLSPEQQSAARKILKLRLAVLAGGAGTGKTTTVRAICDVWERSGGNVVLCALSGKAAVILSQKASAPGRSRPAFTLFSVLQKLEDIGSDDEESCVRLNAQSLVIVDEASMIDLGQWHRLLERLSSGCRLLMVGDPAQLPPIGMGVVFHHLCEIDSITATLKTVHRQSEESGIPGVALDVREGRIPRLKTFSGRGHSVSFLPTSDDRIQEMVLKIVEELGGFCSDQHSLQIICPVTVRHPASVRMLNNLCQKAYADGAEGLVRGYRGQSFAVGNPVLHLRNDYRVGLCNGSLGYIVKADEGAQCLVADIDGRLHEFSGERLDDLDLAYAVTCHKAQGSQCEKVVVPIYQSRLLDPSWIYTAITRAERQVVLVGDLTVFQNALREVPAWRRRQTMFDRQLKAAGF